ncbi:MAG: hypothetical protein AAF320_06740, partial [Myxococcota bacterium]
ALKPQGVLVTNVWLPRNESLKSKTSLNSKQWRDVQLFEVLTHHVLQVKWSQLTQEKMQQLLQQAGFTEVCFSPGTNGLCVLVTALRAST